MARRVSRICTCALLLALMPTAYGQFDDNRVALLPDILPPLAGESPLEEARAQALVSFLKAHRFFDDGRCDPRTDLCLPAQGALANPANSGISVFPLTIQPVLATPVTGPILVNFSQSQEGPTPTFGLTFLATAGTLIYSPFDGQVQLVQDLSAGRTQISIEHAGEDAGLRLSILTGQFDTDLTDADRVVRGQALGRARPWRDNSTRLIYNLIIDGTEVDPEPWIETPAILTQE